MSQPAGQPEDLERGNIRVDNRLQVHPQSMPNQQSQGESNFGDGSGPFFSTYSKAADDEDSKMVERWQKDADRILIFTGLFSVAVAVLLSVTVQDLRPNSQDTSAFYLGNIYNVLADPNATRAPIPSPVAKLVLSSEICDLGELTLVLKLCHQPDLCFVGNIATSMVTSIHQGHSTGTERSGETSANACILCGGHGKYAYSLGG